MADLKKAISSYLKKWLKDKGIDLDDFKEKEKQPVLDMRKKQGGGFWQADIGEGEETEEETKKKKEGK